MSVPLYISMFGGLSARAEQGAEVSVPSQQTGALLAYLALHPKRSHAREELAGIFWPEDSADDARHKLRQRLHALRKLLEEPPLFAAWGLVTTRSAVGLDPKLVVTDVATFEEAVAAASKTMDAGDRARFLSHAITLYKGDLLPGYYQECFVAERMRLSETFQGTLHNLALAHETCGEFDQGIAAARRLVALNPLNEEAHCDLMRLFAAKGQPTAIRRQYEVLERALHDQLASEPSDSTRRLMENLLLSGQARLSTRPVADTSETPRPPSHYPPSLSGGPPHPQHYGQKSRTRQAVGAVALALAAFTVIPRIWNRADNTSTHIGRKGVALTTTAPVWISQYQPEPDESRSDPTAIINDEAGMLYVAGFVYTKSHDVDFLTAKYDIWGRELWHRRYNGTGNDVDRLRSIAVDGRGNVYVTGDSDNGKGVGSRRMVGLDIVTLKYSPDGALLWEARYDDVDHSEDRPKKVLVDDDLNVYVLGECYRVQAGKNTGTDSVLIKYSPEGKRLWVQRFDGADHRHNTSPQDMALCLRGKEGVVVCGGDGSSPASGPETNFVTIKFGPDGRKLWTGTYGDRNGADDTARFVNYGRTGITVVGTGKGLPNTPDAIRTACLIVRYSNDGDLLSVRGSTTDADYLQSLSAAIVADSGDTLAAGETHDAKGAPIFRAVHRDPGGIVEQVYDVPSQPRYDSPTPILVWGPHTQWMVGGLTSRAGPVDFLVANLQSAGGFQTYSGLKSTTEPNYPRAATTGDMVYGHSVIVAGQCPNSYGVRTLTLVRYAEQNLPVPTRPF